MQDFSDALIKEYEPAGAEIDKVAAAQFAAGLKAKPAYLDLDAWHKAYDARLADSGLTNIFTSSGRIKTDSTLWNKIKKLAETDPELGDGLKKLFHACKSDWVRGGRIETKADLDDYNANQKIYTEQAQAHCDRLHDEILKYLKASSNGPETIASLEQICKDTIDNIILVEPKVFPDHTELRAFVLTPNGGKYTTWRISINGNKNVKNVLPQKKVNDFVVEVTQRIVETAQWLEKKENEKAAEANTL